MKKTIGHTVGVCKKSLPDQLKELLLTELNASKSITKIIMHTSIRRESETKGEKHQKKKQLMTKVEESI